MTKRIDVAALTPIVGTLYPSPFDEPCRARERKSTGDDNSGCSCRRAENLRRRAAHAHRGGAQRPRPSG